MGLFFVCAMNNGYAAIHRQICRLYISCSTLDLMVMVVLGDSRSGVSRSLVYSGVLWGKL